ncbi:MAG TPA: enoyl-CoA hydratase/isomerase family protein [Acidimicrobiales bacterium]|nr:enoyl-CoA hydratase/isomerase family protein [Acidimicrobiales bacterium]
MPTTIPGFEYLSVTLSDSGVLTARMAHADRGNTFSPTERDEFPALLALAESDERVHVIVLTGEERVFCGGADHSSDSFQSFKYYDRSRKFITSFVECDVPFVVAMNGPAAGLGLTVALLSDVLVVERDVEFKDSHVLSGVAAAPGPYLWPLSTGLNRAKAALLTGRSFSADDAYAWGLVSEVVDPGRSLAVAMGYAEELAALRPETVRATKRNLNRWLRAATSEVLEHGLSLEFMSFPDAYAATTRGAAG